MLKNTFLKTLFEKRLTIFWWFIAVLLTNVLLIQLFPPIKEAFSGMMETIPASLQGWFGDGQMWSSITGYVSMEIMGQMSLILIVFSIIFSISILTAEETSGTLLTQLSRPIKRRSIFLQKYLAFIVASIIITVGFCLGTFLGTVLLGDIIPIIDLLPSMVAVLLITLSFGSLTFSLGAIFGSKSIPGIVIGFYATIGYFITSMRTGASILDTISKFTPFYYYNNPYVLTDGLQLKNVLILLAIVIVPIIIALPIFTKRDLKTR